MSFVLFGPMQIDTEQLVDLMFFISFSIKGQGD